jgi:hypothetical protein
MEHQLALFSVLSMARGVKSARSHKWLGLCIELQGLKLPHILDDISSSIENLGRPQEVRVLVNVAISRKVPVADITGKGLRLELRGMGARYEAGGYFLAELLFAASIVDGRNRGLRRWARSSRARGIQGIRELHQTETSHTTRPLFPVGRLRKCYRSSATVAW